MLTQCEACGGQMSVQAATCPHCGHPNQAAQQTSGQTYPQHAPPQQRPQTQQGKFLDPNANMRSCLGCIALIFICFVGLFVLGLIRGS